jgi:hypothetical protein
MSPLTRKMRIGTLEKAAAIAPKSDAFGVLMLTISGLIVLKSRKRRKREIRSENGEILLDIGIPYTGILLRSETSFNISSGEETPITENPLDLIYSMWPDRNAHIVNGIVVR